MTEAEILSRLADFQRRPRRLFISPGTSHPGFQKYLKTWRAHLRQISASWDWDAALPADQTGEAILTIAIDHNGRIERVEIARSSGSETIDQTLLALAQDASPFPAPPYGDEYDILHITATMGVTSYRSDDNRVAEPRAGKARATPAQ